MTPDEQARTPADAMEGWLDGPLDAAIEAIDARLAAQTNEILHHPKFQKLESAWRGLEYVIDHVDFRENIRVELLNVSKDDLLDDFDGCSDIARSGLYRLLDPRCHSYAPFGHKPVGLLVGEYEFADGHRDVQLLRAVASVAATWHAPFLARASPQMFGVDTWKALPIASDLEAMFAGPRYARWRSFRERDDARYVGLTMPGFLLRPPYKARAAPEGAFAFEEDALGEHDRYLWGSAAVALATRVADSFAKYRWCPNILGPAGGGALEDLPHDEYVKDGEPGLQIPTEVRLTQRREYELSEAGFIALTFRENTRDACFYSAGSCQKPHNAGGSPGDREAETGLRLGAQLPYLFIVARFAHYLPVLQREVIGVWRERADLERGLNEWISQFVSDVDDPGAALRSRRPLRQARIHVEEGGPGSYRCEVKVRPHFRYMGAPFALSLVCWLDRE